jgi:FixJ family two-component response regulator
MISDLPAIPRSLAPLDPDSLVCVVDDDAAVRRCLERLIRSANFQVETFGSAAEYLGRGLHPGPVCLVLDLRMPGTDGFDLQQALSGRPEQIVFLTGHGDVPMCASAMKAGAVDFLTKPVDDETLLNAVSRALARARELGIAHQERIAAHTIIDSLTPREFEVMRGVISGRLNKQIATELGIAEKTVKIHRGRMMKKTRCASVPDLMRLIQKSAGAGGFTLPIRQHESP